MPTLIRQQGYRVFIYPNDHFPEHVHVSGKGGEAAFWLNCQTGEITIKEIIGYSRNEIKECRGLVEQFVDYLCQSWEKIHGK